MLSNSPKATGIQVVSAAGLLHMCKRLCTFSWWVGSKTAVLGLRSVLQPILGRYMGITAYTITSMITLSVALLFGSASVLLTRLTWVVPGIIAGYVLRERMKWLGVIISLCAIVLFIVHPEGGRAWQYSLYWCIPFVLCLSGADDILSRSLSSTLVAHAVGSVLWLYATNMPAALWLSLIPRVAYERGMSTLGLVAAQWLIERAPACMAVGQRVVNRVRLMWAS